MAAEALESGAAHRRVAVCVAESAHPGAIKAALEHHDISLLLR